MTRSRSAGPSRAVATSWAAARSTGRSSVAASAQYGTAHSAGGAGRASGSSWVLRVANVQRRAAESSEPRTTDIRATCTKSTRSLTGYYDVSRRGSAYTRAPSRQSGVLPGWPGVASAGCQQRSVSQVPESGPVHPPGFRRPPHRPRRCRTDGRRGRPRREGDWPDGLHARGFARALDRVSRAEDRWHRLP